MADQPIHRAAQDGDDDALGRELERDVSPNALDSNGFTPLHHLCLQGDNAKSRLDCLHMLLEAGANVNALDEYQMAPLHFAARNGNADVVAALLKAGADVNRCDAHNYTPLHWACMRRDSDVEPALVLLKNGAEVDARTYLGLGLTPLGEAIVNSRGRLFPILLRAGAALPAETADAYLRKVIAAGGIQDYERTHLNAIAASFAPHFAHLPPEIVRRVVEYAFHVGDY